MGEAGYVWLHWEYCILLYKLFRHTLTLAYYSWNIHWQIWREVADWSFDRLFAIFYYCQIKVQWSFKIFVENQIDVHFSSWKFLSLQFWEHGGTSRHHLVFFFIFFFFFFSFFCLLDNVSVLWWEITFWCCRYILRYEFPIEFLLVFYIILSLAFQSSRCYNFRIFLASFYHLKVRSSSQMAREVCPIQISIIIILF